MSALPNRDAAELTCVMIPAGANRLLLPNVCVAEILPWRRIKTDGSLPSWCAGVLGWRGERLPVVDFDLLALGPAGAADESAPGRCLVVMNRARLSSGRAFYAFCAQGLPRMLQLGRADVKLEASADSAAVAASVTVGTELAVVPDLDHIEASVSALSV